jgi:hypothetical protein
MVGSVYDSQNFKHKQLKMAWSKKTFYPRSIPHKMCYNYILLKIFVKKAVLSNLLIKKVKASTCLFAVVFLCILASWEYSQQHGYSLFFITIRIKVNDAFCTVQWRAFSCVVLRSRSWRVSCSSAGNYTLRLNVMSPFSLMVLCRPHFNHVMQPLFTH